MFDTNNASTLKKLVKCPLKIFMFLFLFLFDEHIHDRDNEHGEGHGHGRNQCPNSCPSHKFFLKISQAKSSISKVAKVSKANLKKKNFTNNENLA